MDWDTFEAELTAFISLVAQVWNEGLYGIDIGHILAALLVMTLFFILRDFITRFIIKRIEKLAARTESTIDDAIIDAVKQPIRMIPIVLGIFLSTSVLNLDEELNNFAANINRSLVTFVIFWMLFRVAEPLGAALRRADRVLTQAMIEWLAKFMRIAIAILGGATILEIWGIQVGPLVAGLGLFGVAVALGAQDLFKNLIAGLFVIGERRFHPGDWVLVQGIAEGTVENIGFRTTTIRQFDKAPVYVPNAHLADNAVVNFSRMTYRRIKWVIGVRYDTRAEQLRTIRQGIEDYILGNDAFVRPEDTSTFVRIDAFGPSSIDLQLYCFTKTTDWLAWLALKEELLLFIKGCVEDAGSDFAYPSQSLYLESLPAGFERLGGGGMSGA